MPTDELIIRLFCMVDDTLAFVNKRSDAHLYSSEIITIGLLLTLKGGRFRALTARTLASAAPVARPRRGCAALSG
jgi:hypothetical protein